MNVVERGAGESALIFLHYFGGSGRTWDTVIERLAPTHHCLAPDLRGFGQSASLSGGYSVSDYADDILELIQSRRLTRFKLVGHSMGGKIALAVAARQPRGLESLVLVAPSPPTPEPTEDDERARLIRTHPSREAALETLGKITAFPLPAPLLAQAVADNLRAAPAAWNAWLESGSREDISAQMATVAVPALVLSGESDPVIPRALLERELLPRLAAAHLSILPDTGHLLPLEVPDAVADAVRGF